MRKKNKPLDLSKLEPTQASNPEKVSHTEITTVEVLPEGSLFFKELGDILGSHEEVVIAQLSGSIWSLIGDLQAKTGNLALKSLKIHPIFLEFSKLVPNDQNNILADVEDYSKLVKSLLKLNLGKSSQNHLVWFDDWLDRVKEDLKISTDTGKKRALVSNAVIYGRRVLKHFLNTSLIEKAKKKTIDGEIVRKYSFRSRVENNQEILDCDNFKDISDILEGISLIYPEFKFPEIHYQGKALVNNLSSMASGPPITSGCKSLRDKEIWNKDPVSGIAYYQHIKHENPNSIITHYIRDWNNDEIKALPFNEATQILDNFGSQTALLHLILAVHAYSKADPTSTKFRLKGTDLIHDLGLAKRSDLSTSQKLQIVLEAVNAVRSLLIKAQWQGERKIRGKIQPVKISVEPSIMWDIVPIKITQKNLLEDDDLIELDISVRIGLWIDKFFNEAGYKMGEALYNFATLAQNILQLDPYHEELALRIALLQSTMPYRSYITVEHWLEENLLGYKDKIAKARTDKRHRKKLKDLWDKTLLALERIGFDIHFDEESYPSQLRPNGKVPRGYFEPWLKAKIKIIPQKIAKPESAIERLERLEREEPEKLTPTKTYSGSELKKARTANKLTQEMIAKYLQCSKGTISKLEKKSEIPLKKYKEMMDAINFVAKTPEKFK